MTEERRANPGRRNDDKLAEKIDNLADLLSGHMDREERETVEIKLLVKQYFDELDAHTHLHHHRHIGDEIKTQNKTEEMWDSIKKNLLEKAILVVASALITYFGVIVFTDVTVRLKTSEPPAHYQQYYNDNRPPQTSSTPAN